LGHPRPSTYGSRDWIGGPFVDWKAKVDLFEQLHREHEFGIGTITGVAAIVKLCPSTCAKAMAP